MSCRPGLGDIECQVLGPPTDVEGMPHGSQQPERGKSRVRRGRRLDPIEGIVAVVGVIVVGMMLVSARLNFATFDRLRPLDGLIEDMKLEVALAHIALEERLTGDKTVDASRDIYGTLDNALQECEALTKGGETSAGYVQPVRGGAARTNLDRMCERLEALRLVTAARLGAAGSSDPGSRSDIAYDATFHDFLALADRQEGFADRTISDDLRSSYRLDIWVAVLLASLLLMAAYVVMRHRRAMEDSNDELARLASIVEGSSDAIVGLDRDARVTSWNRGAQLLYGYARDEVLGRSVDVVIPEGARAEASARREVALASERVESFEAQGMRKTGTLVDVSVTLSPIRGSDGTIVGLAAMTRDISDRRQAERVMRERTEEVARANSDLRVALDRRAELEANLRVLNAHLEDTVARRTEELSATVERLENARQEAERANRAKSEFLSRMSHELRTPLNAILGFGQVLELDDLTPEQMESVSQILGSGRQLLELVDDVLTVTRIDAGRVPLTIEQVVLNEVVDESLEIVRPIGDEHDIELRSTITAGAPAVRVLADCHKLKDVFMHLLSNAIKFNRAGGSVTVAGGGIEPGWARVEVRDTGPGIAEDKLDALFTPFDRLGAEQGEVEGKGLGLPVTKRLVENMGGRISVESRPAEGTRVAIDLPTPESAENDADYAAPGSSARRSMVLFVDDHPDYLELVERVVSRRPDLSLQVAHKGEIALELIRRHHPDLVLLDLDLPDLAGEEVLDRLRASADPTEVPVVVISARGSKEQADRLLGSGADAYLTKPLDAYGLLQAVDRLLRAPAVELGV
jgi:PAS domain S-box-containing protein